MAEEKPSCGLVDAGDRASSGGFGWNCGDRRASAEMVESGETQRELSGYVETLTNIGLGLVLG